MSVLGCSGIWELKYNSTNKTLEFRDQKELCSHEQLILLPHEQRPQHQVLLLLPGVLQPLEHQGQWPLRLLQIQKDAKKGGRCTIEQQPCQVMLSNNHTCSLAPSAALTPPALVAQLGTLSFSSVSSELPGPSRASLRGRPPWLSYSLPAAPRAPELPSPTSQRFPWDHRRVLASFFPLPLTLCHVPANCRAAQSTGTGQKHTSDLLSTAQHPQQCHTHW